MKQPLHNGDKLPAQSRTVSLQFDAERAAADIDQDNRIVRNVSISSEEPYDRYYGTEILSHDPGSVNLDRFNRKAAPLLLNHDRGQLIGKPQNVRIENRRVVVDLKFAKNALATECFQDLIDGILTECSIGYSIDKFEVDEKEETFTATRWEIFECSLVTIPADTTVGVGRDMEPQAVVVETKEKVDTSEPKAEKPNSRATQHAPNIMDENNNPPAPDLNAERAKWQSENKERVAKINGYVGAFKIENMKAKVQDLARKAIEDGTSFTDFRQSVMDNWTETQPLETPNAERDGGPINGGRIQVIGERAQPKTLGQRFVESEAFKRIQHVRAEGGKVAAIQLDEFDNFRATFATSSVTGYSGIVQIPQIYNIGVQRPTVADLMPNGTTNLGSVPYMRETSITNAATTVAEAGAKPEATFALTQTSAPVVKIAVTIPVTDEAFEDIATLASYIDGRLRWMVETTEEAQLLNGLGTGSEMTGILQTSGIQTQAKGSDTTFDAIRKAKNLKVRAIGFAEPSGIVIHPNDWDELEGMKDGNEQYYGGGPFTGAYGTVYPNAQRVWGLVAVVTTGITEGTALVGAFMDAMIFRKKGITIDSTNSHASEFANNIVRLRAEERLALAVFRPKSFCQVTGI